MNLSIFIVEDDPWYGELLAYHLGANPDYEVIRYTTGKDALANLYKQPHIVTLDYSLPDLSGTEVLKKIKAQNPAIEVVMISGQEDVSTAVELLKTGAFDYLVKDEDTPTRLWISVLHIREKLKLQTEVEQLREQIGQKYEHTNSIKGNSPAIKRIFSLIEKACQTNITVSITGETGSGKELVARAIHSGSERRKKPFVAINMAAIPKELLESELFGYEKGAFTGANNRRIGKFEEAQKGTLFLDEIGDLDLGMQTKLLRVLQERELTRVGGQENIKLDIRVIVTTHRNLAEEVQQGRFREDLYFRLYGLPIEMPPLRERGTDILMLAKYFADGFCKDNKMAHKTFAEDAKEKLMAYSYPGNIRELKAVIDLAVVLSDDAIIQANDISFISTSKNGAPAIQEGVTLKDYERQIISQYLAKYEDNVLLVADKLQVSKSKIYAMLKDGELTVS